MSSALVYLACSSLWLSRRVFCSPIIFMTTVLTNPVFHGLVLQTLEVRVMFLGSIFWCFSITILLLSLEDPRTRAPSRQEPEDELLVDILRLGLVDHVIGSHYSEKGVLFIC